jgi:3-hydroxyisobutyrate dehydrogenase-like beta-hydroxyacid dehydrogenase
MSESIGVVGLGNAGLALAGALVRRFEVYGFDQKAARMQESEKLGIKPCGSVAELVKTCEIIFLSLPTPEASRAVAQSMSSVSLSGKLLIETSTVDPKDVIWLLEFAQTRGASAMDAAVLGGIQNLAEGKTTFLVGADPGDYARVQTMLESVSKKIFYMGPAGNGMRIKLINNAVAHTTMVVLLEAAAMAAKSDIPLDVFYELMNSDSGLTRPLTHRLKERAYRGQYEGGMSTANARKDSLLALAMAQELHVPVFTMQASHTVYEIGMQQGLANLDYASIAKLWESWGGLSFKTK